MIKTRFNKVLLVAPDIFPNQLLTDYDHDHVKHVSSVKSIFPSIYALAPELIILDFDFIGNDIEKVLRRIKVNRFYDRIKIHCYKSQPNGKIDDLLKTLGVDQFIYSEDLQRERRGSSTMSSVNSLFDTSSMLKWTSSVAN